MVWEAGRLRRGLGRRWVYTRRALRVRTALPLAKSICSDTEHKLWGAQGASVLPILKVIKLRLRELTRFVPGPDDRKWLKQGANTQFSDGEEQGISCHCNSFSRSRGLASVHGCHLWALSTALFDKSVMAGYPPISHCQKLKCSDAYPSVPPNHQIRPGYV